MLTKNLNPFIVRTEDGVPPTPPADNTVKEMRGRIDALTTQLKEAEGLKEKAALADQLQARLTEIERSKLEESDRLKLELADAQKKAGEADALRDEVGRFQSKAQGEYESIIASVPEEKRAMVEALSKTGSWADRVDNLRNAMSLMGTPPVVNPAPRPGAAPPANAPTGKMFNPSNPYAGAFGNPKA